MKTKTDQVINGTIFINQCEKVLGKKIQLAKIDCSLTLDNLTRVAELAKTTFSHIECRIIYESEHGVHIFNPEMQKHDLTVKNYNKSNVPFYKFNKKADK